MLKNVIGSLVFVAAVLALVNFVGNMMVNPSTAPNQARVVKPEPAMKAEDTVSARPEVDAEKAHEVVDPKAAATSMVASGKKIFKRKCASCHTFKKGDRNRTGPNLWGVIGRDKAAMEGFRYSTAMKAKGGTWTEAELSSFIAGPRTFVPDTKMTFAGLKSETDRTEVIAYIKTLSD